MSDKKTAVLVVMDGLGDRPLKELGGKTPLQAAKTPTFDRLAREGQNGLMGLLRALTQRILRSLVMIQ